MVLRAQESHSEKVSSTRISLQKGLRAALPSAFPGPALPSAPIAGAIDAYIVELFLAEAVGQGGKRLAIRPVKDEGMLGEICHDGHPPEGRSNESRDLAVAGLAELGGSSHDAARLQCFFKLVLDKTVEHGRGERDGVFIPGWYVSCGRPSRRFLTAATAASYFSFPRRRRQSCRVN